MDNLAEAVNAVLARPGRVLLIGAATLLGVATLVATLGLASTARAQVKASFNEFAASEVTVLPAGDRGVSALPASSTFLAERVHGVLAAGRFWGSRDGQLEIRPGWDSDVRAEGGVFGVDPGALKVIDPQLITGRLFTVKDETSGVPSILLSDAVASQLKISTASVPTYVFIGQRPFLVMGVYKSVRREDETLLGAAVDANTFLRDFGGSNVDNPSVIVATRAGSAQSIAKQLPLALRVDDPAATTATAPSSSVTLRNSINETVQRLLLVLAGVSVVIGAVGIANGTLASVIERKPEIGLRRALGAKRSDIAIQFVLEGALVGTLGGLLGLSLGLFVVVGLSHANGWAPTIDLAVTSAAPLVGTLTGLLAAALPALRATSVPAAYALRQSV